MENQEQAGPVPVVRDYAPADYAPCRMLWAELTEHHRRLYEDPSIGGGDPGAALDGYLALPERVGSWVAGLDGQVIGLTGLLDRGTLDLTMDLAERRHRWREGERLHGLDFRY